MSNLEKVKLFPFQITGSEFLKSKRFALLADECGIGKSAQGIHACDLLGANKILIVCRAVARGNWQNEIHKFSATAHSCYCVFDRSHFRCDDYSVVICSYELLEFVLQTCEGVVFDVLIVDEAHYIKEPNAKRTKLVLGTTGAIRRAKRAYFLTATPTPNHYGELWPLLYTAGSTHLTYDAFIERFCITRETGFGRQIVGSNTQRASELRGILKPIFLRRTKEEVNLELPPIFYQDLVVPPGKVDISICRTLIKWMVPTDRLDELKQELFDQLGVVNGITDNNKNLSAEALNALASTAKSVSTLRQYTGMQKVEAVVELVKSELDSKAYDKIVLFAIHRDVIESLRQALKPKYGAVNIYGGTDPEKVQQNVEKFQNTNFCKVMIAQVNAAGTSLTFTSANQVLFVEQDWVPGNNHQAAMRCHRIGQKRAVTVRFAGLANSFDQYLAAVLRRKASEIGHLLDGDMESTNLNGLLE